MKTIVNTASIIGNSDDAPVAIAAETGVATVAADRPLKRFCS